MESMFSASWTLLLKYDRKLIKCPDHLKCTLCQNVIIDAVQTDCGCKFCRKCIQNNMNKSFYCPGKKKDCTYKSIQNIVGDPCINILVSNLDVSCPNESCDFDEKLRDLPKHLEICPKSPIVCPYTKLGCICTQLTRSSLHDHLAQEVHHHSVLTIDSLKKINDRTTLINNEHEKSKGLQAMMENKLKVVTDTVDKQKNFIEELKTAFKKSNSINKTLNDKIESLTKELENIQSQMKDMTKTFNEFKINIQEQMSQIEEKDQKKEMETKRAVKEQVNEMRIIKEDIMKVKKSSSNFCCSSHDDFQRQLKCINCTLINYNFGEFIWKIDNFSMKTANSKVGRNEEILSSPFYSHKNGYKFRLKLCPNGILNGKGKYMFISFYFQRGDFDEILEWPFKNSILLSIINQETKEDFVKVVYNLNSTAEQDKHIYNRPKSDNIGFGTINFGNINNIIKDCGVLKEDALFIRCAFSPETTH